MNRTKLKNYAPRARRDFIQAMTDRAAYFGLTAKKIEPVVEQGDVAVIGGRSFPRAVAKKRKALEDRIKKQGFGPTMEAMAYTWFNRLVAIRFMELHGYLDHGYRVLSHPEGKPTPEILEHAEHVDLPGLKKEAVIDLKLAGNKESELYRLLLTAQCNALHTAMPFLFERIDDETELLLPDNLLHSDSLIRKLVNEIDEEDWKEVEIIGWLYQFYISEKKDEVIGKVVASEDIPAATQLFTPNWIVKYLVQNTLGRQWLATYPQSALRQQMEYYIEPAEQTPEVQEQLKAITPTSLNPEELTLLDPACGSGHILVEAYDLFKAIYQERGYRAKDIPALILQKNLFGLEIDDRAAQLAAFALMMKARADDRRIFDGDAKPNVVALQDSQGLNAADITHALNSPILKEPMPPKEMLFEDIEEEKAGLFGKKMMGEKGLVSQADIATLLDLFENAKTFGSLIQVPPKLATKLPEIEQRLNDVLKHGDLTHALARVIKPLLRQAQLLARQYDAVVANPPYLSNSAMEMRLKTFVSEQYPQSKADLFSAFIERNCQYAIDSGLSGFVTPFVWMFLTSYESLRELLISTKTIVSLVQPEYHSFFESAYVPLCAFVIRNRILEQSGDYFDLSSFDGAELQPTKLREAILNPLSHWRHSVACSEFKLIPGSPIAYAVPNPVRRLFRQYPGVGSIADIKAGLSTGDNTLFQREWHEVSFNRIGFGYASLSQTEQESAKWFPCNSGGKFRKWYGNNGTVVNWECNGKQIRNFRNAANKLKSAVRNDSFYFREGLTWSKISIGAFGARYSPQGFLFDDTGRMGFARDGKLKTLLALYCSSVARDVLAMIAPSLSYTSREVASLPYNSTVDSTVESLADSAIDISKRDWDSSELSWDFERMPLAGDSCSLIRESSDRWSAVCQARISDLRELETHNNRIFIETFGLEAVLSSDVSDDQITLYRPDREEDIKRLISYTVGCMMGRYSLDKPGLIYAYSGNQGFDTGQYKTFRADDDGILPLLETDWGIRDDATNRFVEFIGVAWPKEHLEENLKFIADSLGSNNGEQARETIRRYLATGFYKHHLSMYKKRPIYWLFSSGKQRAFQCLVYLHRYHEGTLARMRTEYVIPLQGQITARIEQLEGDKLKATSTSHRKKLQKEQDDLKKQETELRTFEEKLKHAADQKITLDLDDGVKVNYAKFGDLLAESKAITGGKEEE